VQSLEARRTQDFKLNYTKAEEVAKGLIGTGAPGSTKILSTRGSVIFETRTNQLFVTDIPSKLQQGEALIAKLDTPVRQVLIEARIVEASDTFGKSLGVRLGGRPFTLNGQRNTAFGPTYMTPDITAMPPSTQVLSGAGTTANDFVNLPSAGAGGFTPSTFAISLFDSSLTRLLSLEISALEAE